MKYNSYTLYVWDHDEGQADDVIRQIELMPGVIEVAYVDTQTA